MYGDSTSICTSISTEQQLRLAYFEFQTGQFDLKLFTIHHIVTSLTAIYNYEYYQLGLYSGYVYILNYQNESRDYKEKCAFLGERWAAHGRINKFRWER